MIKKMTVEAFLNWAFTKELCKAGSGAGGGSAVMGTSWDAIADFAALGTLIDRSPNVYGVIPGFQEDGVPHPDALAAGNAVRGLASIGFDIPEGWNPFPEWSDDHGLVAAEVELMRIELEAKGDRLSGRHVAALVTTCAILKRGPDWSADKPREAMVTDPQGNPRWFVLSKSKDSLGRSYTVETDGYNRRAKRPVVGAYRKYRLTSSIRGMIIDRLEWQLWQDALAVVADRLRGDLESHLIMPFVPDRQPWTRRQYVEKNVA
ncbi:hypothetical protein [Rhizobium sp.]|jgi:hypothetical protein|uniref:hypothetical protein n=1 Tax=Rhizobium sp. TaxID=391 RepID=UPI002AA6A278